MNDANQGASGRPQGPEDGRRGKRDAPDAKPDPIGSGFDPLAGPDAPARPGRGQAADAGPTPETDSGGTVVPEGSTDGIGTLLREALRLEVDAATPSDLPPIAADETPSLDAAIARYAALPAPADLDSAAWCDALLAQPELRRDLVDVGEALTSIEADPGREALRSHVRQAALGAFERVAAATSTAVVEPSQAGAVPGTPRSARRSPVASEPTPLLSWLGWRAAAAVLLVALGVTIVAVGGLLHDDVTGGNGAGAEAGMRLDHVTEHRLGANPGFASRQSWVRVGEAFAPTADQLVVFGLGQATHVIVGDGDRLRVADGKALDARLMARAGEDLEAAGSEIDLAAVLRLEAGEALIGSEGQRPVLLAVGDELLLVLQRGKCHVAIDPGAEATVAGPAIALAKGTQVTVYRAANGDRAARTFSLAGPKRILLGADGPTAFGTPAASLFRDLELFGGKLDAVPGPERAVRVQATLWRALRGDAKRANGRFRVAARGGAAWLAFQPQSTLYGATALKVWLRAPAATRVIVRAAKDPAGELAALELAADTRKAEPGVEALLLPLPTDWYARLDGGEIVVEIAPAVVDGAVRADSQGYFEGAAFVMGDAAPRHSDPDASK